MTEGFNLKSCHAPAPIFSSCQHLLGSLAKRTVTFLLALMSSAGNVASLVLRHYFRHRGRTSKNATSAFVSHLSVCNCVTGVYLATLAVADHLLGGDYLWREHAWKTSSWCTMAGFLFLLSSEVSVFIVFTATVEHCLAVFHPVRSAGTKKVLVLLCMSWVTGTMLAAIPVTSVRSVFSATAVCMPPVVPLSEQHGVHHYTTAVLVVVNCAFMLLTIVGQGFIYAKVCKKEMDLMFDRQGSRELILAVRVMNIAITDACAWFLIPTMLVLTSGGYVTSVDAGHSVIALAMVTKPSVNPCLYVANVILERRGLQLRRRLLQHLRTKNVSNR